ncbi:hypothetical protein [Nonomuraea typhae]|uniref:Uncharacterized protein n=1 Tax=Nonomuraea typhae TaxID=2603600 RepID=A0ABW7YJ83_9ACTN
MSEIPIIGQSQPSDAANDPSPVRFRTAFVVFQDENDMWGASNDPNLLADHIELTKVAHPADIHNGVKSVADEVFAQKVAANVHGVMMRAAAQAQEAAENARLMTKLKV